MNPLVLPIMAFSLLLGTLITITSSNWLLAWMGIEINTLAIIPLMIQNHHPRATEATTKYFIVQAAAAAMILFSAVIKAWTTGEWIINPFSEPLSTSLLILALALKLGLAPLHSWLPDVLQGLDFTTGMILSTWQKIAPMTLLLQASKFELPLMVILGVTSVVVGGLGGLNQLQTRKIMAYSSIAHLGWMTVALPFAPHLTLMALAFYIITTYCLFYILLLTGGKTINSLAISWTKNNAVLMATPILLFSMGGLPPTMGFVPKWFILRELTNHSMLSVALVIAMASLLSLFFYMRLAYALAFTKAPNTISSQHTWRLQLFSPNTTLVILVMLATLLLPVSPATIALFTS
uniref:NADH-ubiquinone oxidoreductase chain 2 n=1 Tax=Neosynchiropus moyeri TaxID=1147744 RepID=A0A060NTX6_9TELE|nr:NADH dehydrogenase subunit 2 [Neosynchiropus moyeri]BAO84785.1 NADH dehydrogenase subunit 2 [Neosynchiropus moyeri]